MWRRYQSRTAGGRLVVRPPWAKDVRIAVGVIIAAVGVLAAIVLTQPGNFAAFMLDLPLHLARLAPRRARHAAHRHPGAP